MLRRGYQVGQNGRKGEEKHGRGGEGREGGKIERLVNIHCQWHRIKIKSVWFFSDLKHFFKRKDRDGCYAMLVGL